MQPDSHMGGSMFEQAACVKTVIGSLCGFFNPHSNQFSNWFGDS